MSVIIRRQHDIPQDLNFKQHICEILKSCNINFQFPVPNAFDCQRESLAYWYPKVPTVHNLIPSMILHIAETYHHASFTYRIIMMQWLSSRQNISLGCHAVIFEFTPPPKKYFNIFAYFRKSYHYRTFQDPIMNGYSVVPTTEVCTVSNDET